MLIVAVYSRIEIDTKIWGTIIFVLLAIYNYNLFISPSKLDDSISLCNALESTSNTKKQAAIRLSYIFIFLFFIFSLVVEATNGYLYMVPIYLKEFIK